MSYKRLDPEDFLVSVDSITSTVWSNSSPELTTFFTSSTVTNNDPYYLAVYQTASTDATAAVQFSIAYGNKHGSGSTYFNPLVTGVTATKTVYGQFRNLIYGDENANFSFGGTTSNDFWAISPDRARYKEHLMPGTLNLTITDGAGGTLKLTDNSTVTTVNTFLDCGRVYQIVSGSDGAPYSGTDYSTASGSYGLFLPDIAMIILNPLAISSSIELGPNRVTNSNGDNNGKLFRAISGSAGSASFKLNSEESITADYVYVRARNSEFNYTENPSFISGSTGEIVYSNLINSPQTFPTTIGLYNDTNELVAVAKLSRPLLKDFTKETLFRIKLDF